jgi:aquaporin NIP
MLNKIQCKKYCAEFIGTFILVFLGTGAVIIRELHAGNILNMEVAMVFGTTLFILIMAFGSISGAHFNPAVTLAFTIDKRFSVRDLLPFILSQLSGAFLASLLLKYLFPQSLYLGSSLPHGLPWNSFLTEILLAFILMTVILFVASGSKEKGILPALSIGGIVFVEAWLGGPVSGASMNPARSIAPALISGQTQNLWIYLSAPFIGTIFPIMINRFFFAKH